MQCKRNIKIRIILAHNINFISKIFFLSNISEYFPTFSMKINFVCVKVVIDLNFQDNIFRGSQVVFIFSSKGKKIVIYKLLFI